MLKSNMKNIKEGLCGVGKTIGKGLAIATPILAAVLFNKAADTLNDLCCDNSVGYGDAVRAIMSSGMFSSDKNKAVVALKKDGDSEFYKAVVYIVKSGMFSSDKLKAIQEMSE